MPYAIISSPTNGVYGVYFFYREADSKRQDHTKPSWFLPCRDMNHAIQVASAYDND